MGIQDHISVGDKFHYLTLLSAPYRVGVRWRAEFECICGIRKDILVKNVVGGHTKSCGCYGRSLPRVGRITHRLAKTPAWHSYRGMLTRCYNKNQNSYQYYGARGITVCDRWLSGFEAFYADMGDRPEGMTLERINVNGNYEPDNCRWATDEDQKRNRRDNRHLTWKGVTKTIAEWSLETGFHRTAIEVRIKLGWTTEEILTIPPRLGRNQYGL